MSEIMSRPPEDKSPTLNEQDVINWLRQHPRFLSQHPELLDIMTPPKENFGKGVADFQHYMVQRLKADRDEVLETAREIVENTRANMNSQTRIHRAILMLLEAAHFEAFVSTITLDFPSLLDIDIVSLIVETDGQIVPQIHLQGVRAVPPGTVHLLMKDKPIILEANIQGLDEIYGGGAGLVKSQALLKLHIGDDAPAAMIAFGSRDPLAFESTQGTELIAFLGCVTERLFQSWLHIPA
ncbi:MAG: DUF484 family protein [Alphaproteobacteria bacterium]|nr:DUF484 family protein [Alphaproteobacteria bacterium]